MHNIPSKVSDNYLRALSMELENGRRANLHSAYFVLMHVSGYEDAL